MPMMLRSNIRKRKKKKKKWNEILRSKIRTMISRKKKKIIITIKNNSFDEIERISNEFFSTFFSIVNYPKP